MAEPGIRAQLARGPEAPGDYPWKDAGGRILYVGKAKSLRARMRQYVGGHDERAMVPIMMAQVHSFDYYVTKSEVDSLVLEVNLIKETRPPYNVDYRDDKTFPFIALTMSDPFPAIKYTREKHRPGTRYFGPYTDAKAARATIEVVRRVYPICRADCLQWNRVPATGGTPPGRPRFHPPARTAGGHPAPSLYAPWGREAALRGLCPRAHGIAHRYLRKVRRAGWEA